MTVPTASSPSKATSTTDSVNITRQAIAQALASAISATGPPLVATSEGESLVIVSRAGSISGVEFAITPSADPVPVAAAAATTVTFTADLIPRDIWTLNIGADVYQLLIGETYVVDATEWTVDSPANLAATFAALINESAEND